MLKYIPGWMNLPASRPMECAIAKNRHHLAGFEEVRNLCGNEAAEATRQHIVTD